MGFSSTPTPLACRRPCLAQNKQHASTVSNLVVNALCHAQLDCMHHQATAGLAHQSCSVDVQRLRLQLDSCQSFLKVP